MAWDGTMKMVVVVVAWTRNGRHVVRKGDGTREGRKTRQKGQGRFKERIAQGGKRNGDGWLDPSKDNRKVLLHGRASTSICHMARFPRWMTGAPTMAMAKLRPITPWLVRQTLCRICARLLSYSNKGLSIHLCIEDATRHADAYLHLPHLSAMRRIPPSLQSFSTTQSFSSHCPQQDDFEVEEWI